MRITAIHHVQLAMPPGEEDAAVSFYQDLLGVTRVPKPPNLAGRGGAWFEAEDVRIHLGIEADFRPARKAHPAFVVDGLEALMERLSEHGVSAETDEPLARHTCTVRTR